MEFLASDAGVGVAARPMRIGCSNLRLHPKLRAYGIEPAGDSAAIFSALRW